MKNILTQIRQIRDTNTDETVPEISISRGSSFFTGWAVSAFGSLSPGTLNIFVLQMSVNHGWAAACMASLGALLLEVVFVRLALQGVEKMAEQKRLFRILEWITFVFIFCLGLATLLMIGKIKEGGSVMQALLPAMPPLFIGMAMRILTPVCIPYWFAWNTVLLSKGLLKKGKGRFWAFSIGVGAGTFTGHSLYIFGGVAAHDLLVQNRGYLQFCIGSVLVLISLWLLNKILTSKK